MLNKTIRKLLNQVRIYKNPASLLLILGVFAALGGCQSNTSTKQTTTQTNIVGGINLSGLNGWQYQKDGNESNYICSDTAICENRNVVSYVRKPLNAASATGFGKMIRSPAAYNDQMTQSMINDAESAGGTMSALTQLQATQVGGQSGLYQAYRMKLSDNDEALTVGFVWLPKGPSLHIISATTRSTAKSRELSHDFANRIQF